MLINKMASATNFKEGMPSAEYLSNIISSAKSDIMINAESGLDEINAALLEDFFRLTALNQGGDNIVSNMTLENRRQILQEHGIPVGQLIGQNISGFQFEEWLEKIIERVMKDSNLVSYGQKISISGTSSFDLFTGVDDVMKAEFSKAYQEVSQTAQKHAEQADYQYKIKSSVFGKIDTGNYYGDIQIHIEDGYLDKIIPILAQATFTDKGYLTQHDVRIGQTNPFRAFMAIATTDITNSARTKLDKWYQILNCMKGHGHGAPQLFYELRYIYELTGYGGQYIEEALRQQFAGGAKYFIYYGNNTTLKVIPVSRILKNLSLKLQSNKLIKQSSIDYNYALYAVLKMRVTAIEPITFELE